MSKVTLPALVAQLVQDGTAVARAEVAVVRARISTRLTAAKSALILFGAATLVALLSLIGLVVGVVLALAGLVGPALAGLIVLVVGLVIAGILGWLGARQMSSKPKAVAEQISATEHGA